VAAVLVAAAVSQGIAPGATSHAAVVLDSLLVRVYDNAGVPAAERKRAFSRAADILERVELSAAWLECPPDQPKKPAACNTPPAPGEIVVRFVRASPQADRDYSRAIGYSLIDSRTGRGTLATVFIDRVERLAEVARFDRSAILGRAIAHEIGHLLLGTNAHSSTGLMRETWTFEEVRRNQAGDWQFTPTQQDHLQAARMAGVAGARPSAGGGTGGQNPRNLLNKTP
jgi:hypothetical protein